MKKFWMFVVLLALGAGAAVFFRGKFAAKAEASAKPKGSPGVAVILTTATAQDVPIWLGGLGTAQAPNTVTVRPRVGGVLEKVNFTEGTQVKEGDVLAQIDPRPYQSVLAQAEAKMAQDSAQLANAVVESERYRELKGKNAVSQQQVDQAEATEKQLAGLVQADQAVVDAAKLDLDFTTIRAPISGRTGIRLVDAGNLVTANQDGGLVVLTDMSGISVVFTIPQQHLGHIRRNMKTDRDPLPVQAYSQEGELLDEGKLELMDNQIDQASGTLRFKAFFKNEKRMLWPGQFVTAKLLVETRQNVITVEAEAVNAGLDGQFCYVVKADQTVEARSVKTGPENENRIIIEEGLKAGEKVVRVGQNKLSPGAKVSAKSEVP